MSPRAWRFLELAYCTCAGIAFGCALRLVEGDLNTTVGDIFGLVLFSPVVVPLGICWALGPWSGLLCCPIWLGLAWALLRRPSIAAPLALSLWTALGFFYGLDGWFGIMGV